MYLKEKENTMARLLKASTARRRADSFDHEAYAIEGIANAIEDYADHGIFGFQTSVKEDQEDAVVQLLEKAGYTVTYPEYAGLVEWHAGAWPKQRGWFGKLMERLRILAPDPAVSFIPSIMNEGYVVLNISWAPQEDEPKQLELPF
jgi:hypothetical protein